MVENASLLPKSNLAASLLGIVALVLIVSTWSGRRLPLIQNDRASLIALLVIGFAMCMAGGISKTINAQVGWGHAINLIGYLVGILILIVAGSALFHLPLFWLTSDRAAILTIAALVAVKWVNAMVFYLFFNRPA